MPLPLLPVSTSAPPGRQTEIEPGEDQPLAAPAGQRLADEIAIAYDGAGHGNLPGMRLRRIRRAPAHLSFGW